MTKRMCHLPSLRSLQAFEAAGEFGSFTRAAEKLHTTQSSVSRYIAGLEALLGTPLFLRDRQTVRLTAAGAYLLGHVRRTLSDLDLALHAVSEWEGRATLMIACTHAVSHLLLMPRFHDLQLHLGRDRHLRIMTFEYDTLDVGAVPQADIVFSYGPSGAGDDDCVAVLGEALAPVCSPEFAGRHADTLAGPLAGWADLPILSIDEANLGWGTWQDWFGAHGETDRDVHGTQYENYIYLLEHAAAGHGLALGTRYFTDSYISSGRLVLARGDYVPFERALYACLTPKGRLNELGRVGLDVLGRLFDDESGQPQSAGSGG